MPTDLLAKPLDLADPVPTQDLFDLDLVVSTEETADSSDFRSWILCTAGCTSPGGGSNCSYCC
jgi:Gallidermin